MDYYHARFSNIDTTASFVYMSQVVFILAEAVLVVVAPATSSQSEVVASKDERNIVVSTN